MRLLRSQRGSVFIVVSFVLSVVFIFVSLVVSISASELRISQVGSDRNRAQYMALSGIREGMSILKNENYEGLGSGGFAGGSGTLEDPYLIATAVQLLKINSDVGYLNKHYKQISDIDLDDLLELDLTDLRIIDYETRGWSPIVTFAGSYDGNGYLIRNLTIERPDFTAVGLFASLNDGGELIKIGLVDVDINGWLDVGGLVGINNGGIIENCYVMGTVSADESGGFSNAGLLVGSNNGGTIKSSYAIGSVNGKGGNVGGLIGKNIGSPIGRSDGDEMANILNSYAHVTVEAGHPSITAAAIGGLVGYNTGSIRKSFATGSVVGVGNRVGGLVGHNAGSIDNSYAEGIVAGGGNNETLGEYVGGLVGFNEKFAEDVNEGRVKFTYAIGLVKGTTSGGLIGGNDGGLIEKSFYLEPVDPEYDAYKTFEGSPKTSQEMKLLETYEEWDITSHGAIVSGELSTSYGAIIWLINEGESYPYFNFSGFEDGEYEVTTAAQLDNVRKNLKANYIQTQDIDLAAYGGGRGWRPIGDSSILGQPFQGTYNGNGKKIKNLKIDGSFPRELFIDEDELVLWLDAADQSTVGYVTGGAFELSSTTSTNYVNAWLDKSGKGNHVYQDGEEEYFPEYVTGDPRYNNRNAVRFNPPGGSNKQFLARSSTPTESAIANFLFLKDEEEEGGNLDITTPQAIQLGDKMTAFIVATSRTENLSNSAIWSQGGVPSSQTEANAFSFYGIDNDIALNFSLQDRDRSETKLNQVLVNDLENPNVFYIGTRSNEYHFFGLNGETGITLRRIDRSETPSAISLNVGKGPEGDFVSDVLQGDILEYLIYNRALGALERERVEAYLMKKWGVDDNPTGLFGYVDARALAPSKIALQNIILENVEIDGEEQVGGLVGRIDGGEIVDDDFDAEDSYKSKITINNCTLTGLSRVSGTQKVGGLVGNLNGGAILHSYVEGNITGSIGVQQDQIGGMVGQNLNGLIRESQSRANVLGNSGSLGGLVGENEGWIQISYASGKVEGEGLFVDSLKIGGLVGFNNSSGKIKNAYATGDVLVDLEATGAPKVGGLVGANEGNIQNTYAAGVITGVVTGAAIGGLVGENNTTEGGIASFYDKEKTGQIDENKGSPKSTQEMKKKSTFDGWDFATTGSGIWVIEENISYPQFFFDGGDGTQSNPYRIRTAAQLDNVRNYLGVGKFFLQVADINLFGFGRWYDGGKGWKPIGDNTTDTTRFRGNYDGNLYRINNLYINRPDTDSIGLFGWLEGGSIKNLGIVNVDVRGNFYVGGLLGRGAAGNYSNNYVTGKVTGTDAVGGLLGFVNLSGITEKSYSSVTVVGNNKATTLSSSLNGVGGLIGVNHGEMEISLSYASGDVSGYTNVGGLVGYLDNGAKKSSNNYAKGKVTGDTRVGGLVGRKGGDNDLEKSYSTGEVIGEIDAGGFGGLNANSGKILQSYYYQDPKNDIETQVTQSAMKLKSTYDDGTEAKSWDFDEIWAIDDDEDKTEDEKINEGYPYHQHFKYARINPSGVFASDTLAEDDARLNFGYIRRHNLKVTITYSEVFDIYTIEAQANYRNSKFSITRFVKALGSGNNRTIIELGGF
jgi:hypothetical protein